MRDIYITGDQHGRFKKLVNFCRRMETSVDDVVIVLGDAGINFYGWGVDRQLKFELSAVPVTFFCIHGNHEMRPESLGYYSEQQWNGGIVYVEEDHPNILFAKDGEIYDFNGVKTLVLGGAYSLDKNQRILKGLKEGREYWWADEQPSDEIKARAEQQLDAAGWKVDVVLSHTAPLNDEPTDAFLAGFDQTKVDKSTEEWLQTIENRLEYRKWYCGHYHVERDFGHLRIMFKDIEEFWRKEV